MEYLKEIELIYTKLKEKESLKNLSFFLLINLIFMFVEVVYGLFSNSLGLLTDGAHMLLDCSAIVIGLYSSYLSDAKSDSSYNFGYQRSEVLGTFINSVFLIFVSLYIVFESVERFISPKEIHADHLILVSFLGLIVNLIGVYYLHGEHGHGHGHGGCSHSTKDKDKDKHIHLSNTQSDNKHEHKHEDEEAGHTHHNHNHDHDHNHTTTHNHDKDDYNENLYAIYIHILADALGSVSVLISSFLIRYYGLNFTDPLCSLFISIMILYSAWPVLKSSSLTLLHYLPDKLEKKKTIIEKANLSIGSLDMWVLNQNHLVCDLKIHYENTSEVERSELKDKVKSILKENKIEEFFIELN